MKVWKLAAVFAAAGSMAACGGGGSGGSTGAPDPPQITQVTVRATYQGNPLVAVVIVESSGYDAQTHTASGIIGSTFTDTNGDAHFTGLMPGAPYCFSLHFGYKGSDVYGVSCQQTVASDMIYINMPQ